MNHLMLSTHQHHINSKEAHRPFLIVLFEERVYPLVHMYSGGIYFCAVCSYHERTAGVIKLASQHFSLLALILRSKARYLYNVRLMNFIFVLYRY